MRWSQLGFGRTSSTSANQQTARNLMGFEDGTGLLDAGRSSSPSSALSAVPPGLAAPDDY